jgi:phosphoribosyl 1,2-cyclic phosphodiesterase
VEFARKAEVGRLVLFHHDPYHDDDELDTLQAIAAKMFDRGDDAVQLAYEGMRIDLNPRFSRQ